jgi:hypothetical protein
MGKCSPGKDVQDKRGTVNNLGFEPLLNVAQLPRRKLVVKHDDISLEALPKLCDLLQLAGADIGA